MALAELELLPRIPWDQGFHAHWTPGEAGAQRRLEQFTADAIGRYTTQRDQPAASATSGLSPHLHFGELSPRSALAAAREAIPDCPGRDALAQQIEGVSRSLVTGLSARTVAA